MKKRAIEFIKHIRSTIATNACTDEDLDNKTQNILVVSHGGLIKLLTNYISQDCKCDVSVLDEEDQRNILNPSHYVKNAGISNFELFSPALRWIIHAQLKGLDIVDPLRGKSQRLPVYNSPSYTVILIYSIFISYIYYILPFR